MADASDLHDQAHDLARDLQKLTGSSSGGFNPLAMLTGERQFHSVFLAPLSPAIVRAGEQFLADGTGALTGLVEQFKSKGVEPAEAAARVRALIEHARGMLVVVMADNQGLVSIPQLFFGAMNEDYRDQAVDICGDDFPDSDGLKACLIGLSTLVDDGAQWPQLFTGVRIPDDASHYWVELGRQLVASMDEGLFGAAPDRLADLGHWIGSALASLASDNGESWYLASRALCVGGDVEAAARCAGQLLADFEPQDEALALLVQQLVDIAVAKDQPQLVLEFFAANEEAIDEILGGLYELELPRFKATVAAMRPTDELLSAAERLKKADRKAFRHDLNREPLWRVAVADPGELLDTNEAADRLDRSINFVAKRLEQGTIPYHRDGETVRIPVQALDAWKAVVDQFELID